MVAAENKALVRATGCSGRLKLRARSRRQVRRGGEAGGRARGHGRGHERPGRGCSSRALPGGRDAGRRQRLRSPRRPGSESRGLQRHRETSCPRSPRGRCTAGRGAWRIRPRRDLRVEPPTREPKPGGGTSPLRVSPLCHPVVTCFCPQTGLWSAGVSLHLVSLELTVWGPCL